VNSFGITSGNFRGHQESPAITRSCSTNITHPSGVSLSEVDFTSSCCAMSLPLSLLLTNLAFGILKARFAVLRRLTGTRTFAFGTIACCVLLQLALSLISVTGLPPVHYPRRRRIKQEPLSTNTTLSTMTRTLSPGQTMNMTLWTCLSFCGDTTEPRWTTVTKITALVLFSFVSVYVSSWVATTKAQRSIFLGD
jgi:hypothetical protein